MRIQANPITPKAPRRSAPPESRSGPATGADVVEVGQGKTPVQHAGTVGIGLSSLANATRAAKAILRVTAETPIARLVPGLNLGVATVEGVNAFHMHKRGHHVEAGAHLGNAVGCFAGFLEEGSAWAMAAHQTTLGSRLALTGGLLGLGVGLYEIRLGKQVMEQTGSRRTLVMGLLDAASGVTSLVASRVGGNLGMGLLLGSGILDLAGIAVDYKGDKIPFLKGTPPKKAIGA